MRDTEFADFYAATKDSCLRAAVAGGVRREAAEEAVAEAFAKAWAAWPPVRLTRSPTAWVVRAAVTTHISWWRKQRREVLSDPAPRPVSDPTAEVDLLDAIASLPPRQREVVELRYLLDLDTAATAAWLGIATGTVKATGQSASPSIRLAPHQLRVADRWCRTHPIALAPTRLPNLRVVGAGDTAVSRFLLYSDGLHYLDCRLAPDGGGGGGGGGSAVLRPSPGRELVSAKYVRSNPQGGASSALLAFGRVAPEVARVTGTVEGAVVQAAVGEGWYWLTTPSEGTVDDPPPPIDLRAYDADGRLLTLITTTG